MSIQILTENPVLATMLKLELKRQGRADDRSALVFVDLDTVPLPRTASKGTLILLSSDAARLAAYEDTAPGLLPLPLSVAELETLLDRLDNAAPQTPLRLEENALWLNGQHIALSATEAALIALLYRNRDRVVTEDELNAVLGESAARTNTLAVYLYRLRRKLCADGLTRIRTVRGQGYRWIEY